MLKQISYLIVFTSLFGCSFSETSEVIDTTPINLNDTIIAIPLSGFEELTEIQFEIKNGTLLTSAQYHKGTRHGITKIFENDSLEQIKVYSSGQLLLLTDFLKHRELELYNEQTAIPRGNGTASFVASKVYDHNKNLVDSLTMAFILDKSLAYDNSSMNFKVISPHKYCDIIFGKFDLTPTVNDTLFAIYDVQCGVNTVLPYDKISNNSNIIQGIIIAHDSPRNADGSFVAEVASVYVIYEIVGDLKKEIDRAEQEIEELLD